MHWHEKCLESVTQISVIMKLSVPVIFPHLHFICLLYLYKWLCVACMAVLYSSC